MLFRKCGCLVGPENSIFRKLISVDPKKKALTTEMNFRSYFHFKRSPERERERARGRQRPSQRRSHVQAPVSVVRKHQRRRSRSEIANSPSRQSQPARCFARSRLMARSSDWSAPSNPVDRERQSGCCVCFSSFVFFLVAFSKHQKIFFGKFFEIQPNT